MILVQLIRFLHFAVLVFVIFGWSVPSPAFRLGHMAFIPMMLLHWRMSDNVCVLTRLESAAKRRHLRRNNQAEPPAQLQSLFIKNLWKKAFGRLPTDAALERVIHGVVWASFALSAGLWLAR